MNEINQEHPSSHDTSLNNGETWIRPTLHLAANRQQPDAPSGVESSHPEYSGRLQVSPRGRVFINHENAALISFFGSSGFFGLSGFSGETIGPDNQTDQTDQTDRTNS